MIIVAQDGSGAFTSIQEAVDSVSMLPETIYIKNGVYHERVEIKAPFLTFEGEDAEKTILEYDEYANKILEDGEKCGTFRSYTLLVAADNFTCRNMTVANISGFGKEVGQALAVYAEGDHILFSGCRLLGHQDTLFTGPLPNEEAKAGGFKGPTEFAPRRLCRQIYENCYIEGEVDFIFGSAAAYFENCTLYSLNRDMDPNGYVTAPSTYENQKYGYVFHNCRFKSNCPENSVYLGRPWRNYGQTVLIHCELDGHIKDEGFHDWNKPETHNTVFLAEYDCYGDGYKPKLRADFVKQLSADEAAEYTLDKFKEH